MTGTNGQYGADFRRSVVGMPCAVCRIPVQEGDRVWVALWLGPPDDPIESSVLGSMDCFVRWARTLADHYAAEHLDEGRDTP